MEQAVATAVAMNANGDNGIPVPYYTEDVSTKVVKIIQSYTCLLYTSDAADEL